jgi:hypothetical protein
VSFWYPATDGRTDQHRRTIDAYQSELSDMLSVPVRAESLQTDGGQPSLPDLLVRRGTTDRLRATLCDDRPAVPSPGCTSGTGYPHEARQPRLSRRLLERIAF